MSGNNKSVWLLDLGIGLLGVLVMIAVFRVLRFDDPRILYNAWTYCLAIPTVIIGSTMLAHVLIPQSAERSIQTGFLLSVLVHLGLTVAAINTVLFSGLWQEGSETMEVKLQAMSQGTSFQPPVETSEPSRPDYMRPVQAPVDPASRVELRPLSQAQEALELLDTPDALSLDASRAIENQQLADPQMLEPELAPQQAEAPERPELTATAPARTEIQAESVEQTPLAQVSVPQSRPFSIERSSEARSPGLERSTAAPATEPLVADMSANRELNARGSAQADRVERELSNRPLQVSAPEIESSLTLRARSDRMAGLPPTAIKVPVEGLGQAAGDSGTVAKPTNDSLGELLGGRGELARRRTTASAATQNIDGGVGQGGLDYQDPVAARVASGSAMRSGAKPQVASMPSLSIPSISDTGSSSLGLDRFRPSVNSSNQAAKGLVPVPAPAFQQRSRRMDQSSGQELQAMGPLGPKTEESIELGLAFLAKHQRSDGSWKLEDYGQRTMIRSDTAATALSLLSFQGAGYSHVQFKYQSECRKAIEFLVAGQQANGDLYRPMDQGSDRNGWLYSHAIATLALCEAYGMTQDEALRTAAQRAVDFLVYSQDRQEGGWRYAPRIGSDTSVTGWGMMALKSAELAGLYVPRQTYEGIQKWLDHSQASARERYLYRYNWLANTPETKHGAEPTSVMTSVGLLMRLYTGWKRDNTEMAQGADWLIKRLPSQGTRQAPLRDTYYWYYATQVLFHMGGDRWTAWHESLYPMLIETQVTQGPYAGSWEPLGPIPDAWGEYAGRLYVTTMNLLSLEVTYRHLPIYEATAR